MNHKLLIFGFLIMCFFHGCRRVNSQKYSELLNEELSFRTETQEIPFSISLTHIPTIKYDIFNKSFFLAVDTGSVDNYLVGSKIVKTGLISKKFYKIAKILDYQNEPNLRNTFGNEIFTIDPNGTLTTGMKKNPHDGFLGLAYLEQYHNVVFDYINKTISYNKSPICENEIPMHKRKSDNLWYTSIECNGVKSNALIDTGCFSVFINKKNVKSTVENNEIINIRLGTLECSNICISENKNLITNKNAMNGLYKNENIIGYPCFKDHIIQLDFENNVFRIK